MKLLIDTWFDGLAENAAHEARLAPLPRRWPRYTPGMRACWLATAAALARACGGPRRAMEDGHPRGPLRTGCVVAGPDACHAGNRAYFADYLGGGRALGRAALFIHTLPTAAAAECCLHFNLGGPLLYALPEDGRLADALDLAEACLGQDGVDLMLVLPCSRNRAGCLALARGEGLGPEWRDFQIEGCLAP